MAGDRNSLDAFLRERAARVVPSGMWGHLHAAGLPEGYPQFFARGKGGVVWDVDGNRYVDLMCSWGPNMLGHHHPEVEEAVQRQRALGDCLNGPTDIMVELAEKLVDTIGHANWAMFQKNGSDATTTCVTIARAATGRRKILAARGSYHGAVPWCSPSLVGITAEDRAHIVMFNYNDVESLRAAMATAGDDLAAVLIAAFRHDLGRDQEMPTKAFADAVRELCNEKGSALILDEVRAGFRLHNGGSWEPLGVRPDLSAWSKVIANGHALAAVTGSEWLRKAASSIFVTGSFWCAAVPMAAAVATLKVLTRDDVVGHISRLGQQLRDGLALRADRHGLKIHQTGPAQMPMVLFDDDADLRKGNAFCRAALRQGVYFHPRHNMFLCAAHTEENIAEALEAAEHGFAAAADAAAAVA